MSHFVELRTPAGNRQIRLDERVELGREGTGIIVDDPALSRRHLLLDATGPILVVTDLGSSNGSFLGGRPLTEPTAVHPGAEIRAGATTVVVLPRPDATPVPRGASPEEERLANGLIEVRYRNGTHGATLARAFSASATKARRNLAGLGSEPWGTIPILHLIDPYHDGSTMVTAGTAVDTAAGEAWFVVTPESPPEDPHRALSILFGAALPSADELGGLIEGFGLHRGGSPDVDADLRGARPPALSDADDRERALLLLSFVRFLIARRGEDSFRQLIASPAGRVEATATEVFGASLEALELEWRDHLTEAEPPASTGQFLRLSLAALAPYRWKQAEILVYMLLSLAFVAAFPLVTRRLFDTAIPTGELSEVFKLLLVLGVAFVVSLLAAVRQAYQTAWVTGAVSRDLRQSLFDRVQRLPTSWYGNHSQGDVLARLFGDVEQVKNGLSEAIGQGVYQTLSLIVSGAIMLTIDLRLGALVLLSAPLVGLVYRRMASQAQARVLAVQDNTADLLSIAAENYRALPVVKLFGLMPREQHRFAAGSDDVFTAERQLSLWTGYFGLSVNLIVTVLRLAVLGLGSWLIFEDRLSVGGLVAFLTVMGDVLAPVTVLVSLGQDVQSSLGSLIRINEILDAPTEPEGEDLPPLAPVAASVELRDVSLAYTADHLALDGFSVTIPAGAKVAFVGPSGSGKSTVLRLLMRLYDPDDGSVTVDGVDLRTRSLSSWRDQIGVVFQDSFLFDVSLWENLALGRPGASTDEIQLAARGAEVDSFVGALADGWNTRVGEGGTHLSGGQRQRVAIARALLRNPRILLLDEATSALDAATERAITETLDRVAVGRTVVAITHRLGSVSRFDKICVVVDGRLVEQGTHPELLAVGGTYASLWAEQTGAGPPPATSFDAVAALRRIPFLAAATEADLEAMVRHLEPTVLPNGAQVDEGSGLVVLEAGRADVVTSDAMGHPVVVAELRPGDAFGVGAALGAGTGTTLHAREHCRLLRVPTARYDHLVAPAVLAQAPPPEAASALRLSRVTLGAHPQPF